MLDFFSLLEAAHFRVLSRDDWDAAMANDFTVIPVLCSRQNLPEWRSSCESRACSLTNLSSSEVVLKFRLMLFGCYMC